MDGWIHTDRHMKNELAFSFSFFGHDKIHMYIHR